MKLVYRVRRFFGYRPDSEWQPVWPHPFSVWRWPYRKFAEASPFQDRTYSTFFDKHRNISVFDYLETEATDGSP